jgi:hypothetical protein
MKLRRIALQSELFSSTPRQTARGLPAATRAEVVQLLERLLREVMQAQLRHPASLETDDEQDQR